MSLFQKLPREFWLSREWVISANRDRTRKDLSFLGFKRFPRMGPQNRRRIISKLLRWRIASCCRDNGKGILANGVNRSEVKLGSGAAGHSRCAEAGASHARGALLCLMDVGVT